MELHAILEFFSLSKGEAKTLGRNLTGLVDDVQPHGVWPSDPQEALLEQRGMLKAMRRVSVFITAPNWQGAEIKLQKTCERLNSMPGYCCEVTTKYMLTGNDYRRVA